MEVRGASEALVAVPVPYAAAAVAPRSGAPSERRADAEQLPFAAPLVGRVLQLPRLRRPRLPARRRTVRNPEALGVARPAASGVLFFVVVLLLLFFRCHNKAREETTRPYIVRPASSSRSRARASHCMSTVPFL